MKQKNSWGIFFYLDENKKCVFNTDDIQAPLVYNQNITDIPLDKLCSLDSSIDPKLVENISWLPLASLTGRDLYTGCFITKCYTLKAYYSTFEWTLIHNHNYANKRAQGLAI